MTAVPLGRGAYKRVSAGTPEVKLLNRYLEANPANPREGTSILARPGTTVTLALNQGTFVGFGPMRGNYELSGLFSNSLFVIFGTRLYRVNSDMSTVFITGTVAGTGRPEVTWQKGPGFERLWIADGSTLQFYDGVTNALQSCAVPGGQIAKSLTQIAGYVLVSIQGKQTFYWVKPGATTIDALSFANKEGTPDSILHMKTVGDQVMIIGEKSTETWYATGDSVNPFAPMQGRVYARGAIANTPVVVDDAVMLVGDDGRVYTVGLQSGDATDAGWGVTRISNNGIEERIRRQIRREQGLTP